MSDPVRSQPPSTKTLATRVVDFAESGSYVIFLAVLLIQSGPLLAVGAVWLLLNVSFLLIWPGKFTFAWARSPRSEGDVRIQDHEPRTLSVAGLMPLALGVVGGLHIARISDPLATVTALGFSVFVAVIPFTIFYAVDPPIRTAKQMMGLSIEALLWAFGTVAAADLLANA